MSPQTPLLFVLLALVGLASAGAPCVPPTDVLPSSIEANCTGKRQAEALCDRREKQKHGTQRDFSLRLVLCRVVRRFGGPRSLQLGG